MEDKQGLNMAALAALLNGDMENASIAMTPGGIERQEKQGQLTFTKGDYLPKEMQGDCRAVCEAWGIVFGKEIDEKKYWSAVKAGFCSKRKTLENNLANSFHLPKAEVRGKLQKAGLKSNIRAQELTLENWLSLAKLFHSRFVDSDEENLI